jgi:hypothetical protein
LKSKYKGQNFVFDERLAERITDDVVSTCMQCGTRATALATATRLPATCCLVQCENVRGKYADCCSLSCREIHQLPDGSNSASGAKAAAPAAPRPKPSMTQKDCGSASGRRKKSLLENGTLHPELTDISVEKEKLSNFAMLIG